MNRATFDRIERSLREAERDRRPDAADRLLAAAEAWPRADWPLLAAAEQLERTQWHLRGAARIEMMRRELAILDELIERGDRGRATNLAYFVHHKLAQLTGDEVHRERAMAMARRLAEADPHGIAGWNRLGDLLWEYGRRAEAVEAYERSLQADRNFALDPLRQLSADDRRTIETRIDESRKGG
jgi:tetratricopeptide (TPR) repeat protein